MKIGYQAAKYVPLISSLIKESVDGFKTFRKIFREKYIVLRNNESVYLMKYSVARKDMVTQTATNPTWLPAYPVEQNPAVQSALRENGSSTLVRLWHG